MDFTNLDLNLEKPLDVHLPGFIHLVPVPCLLSHPGNNQVLHANQLALNLFGFEDLGQVGPVSDYYESLQDRERILQEFQSKGRVQGFEARLRLRNDDLIWVRMSGRQLKFQGETINWVFIEDVSEEKKLQEALKTTEQNFRNIFEKAPMAMAITALSDGLVKELNPAGQRLYKVEDIVHTPLRATDYYVNPDDRERLLKQLQEKGYVNDFELQMHDHEGSVFDLIMHAAPVVFNAAPHLLTSFANITEYKELQRQLEKTTEQAERASQAKSEFLATMSHEIRTPLNGALSMSHLLTKTSLDEDQRRYVDAINFSGESLLQVLGDVLDLSKLEAGRIELVSRPFRLTPLLEGILDLFLVRAQEKRTELKLDIADDIPRGLCGDAMRLRQILLNLIGNAVKFTEDGEVRVRLSRPDSDGGKHRIRFDIEDTGIGISEKAQSQIFSSFSQADTSISRRFGGTGLGLAICQRMVQLMDSKIELRSEPGQGSCFSFEILLEEAVEDQFKPGVPEKQPVSRPLQILLVEDDRINRVAQTALLEQAGHQITLAENGLEAIKLLDNPALAGKLDLILMDIHMPELDGLETMRRLTTMGPAISSIKIIALSADITQENIRECMNAGASTLIAKPIQPKDLENTLQQIAVAAAPAI